MKNIDKDLTFINQNIVKNTINHLLAEQELPAKSHHHHSYKFVHLILSTIHKPYKLSQPIVSAVVPPNFFPAI